MADAHLPRAADHPEYAEKRYCTDGAELLSIEPWNTAAGGRAACEDMPRKSIDKSSRIILSSRKGATAPFSRHPARTGAGRAHNGSRDESLVGFGATPQGLKTLISAIFEVHSSLFFDSVFS